MNSERAPTVDAVRAYWNRRMLGLQYVKAALYTYGFAPLYNLLLEKVALRHVYKPSVTAVKV